jgi:hypothetical protein
LKKVLFVFLLIIIAIGALLYYLWSQATSLPEWYKTGSVRAEEGSVIIYGQGLGDIKEQLGRKIEDQIKKTPTGTREVEIRLNEIDANRLIASMITENAEKYKYLKAIKASKTSIRDGNLDFGFVINVSDIVEDKEHKDVKETGPRIVDIPGFVKGREFYAGLAGKFGFKNGRLILDEDGKIRIGELSFSLSYAMKRLGVSEERLRETIRDLELGKLKINNIQAVKDTLLLKGSLD